MDEKTLATLEFLKIVERLAGYCAFAASEEKARQLRPTNDIFIARQRLSETSEAVRLLATHPDLTIGGARDVRASVELARHGGVLAPNELLDVKSTLVASRSLFRTFERLPPEYPLLVDLVKQLPGSIGLIDAISQVLSERGEILDQASDRLNKIRREIRIVHDRLLSRMQRMVNDPRNGPYLQEALVTQRDGRYVLPLRAEFKGRIRSIVHDQSSSGATLFVEPLVVVEMNNQYRELQLAERDEERRILTELSRLVGLHGDEILQVIEVLAMLDFALARAKYAEDLVAIEPKLHSLVLTTPSGLAEANPVIRLFQARHPLLDPQTVVPIDFELDAETFALVITGPNTGGKTVALKTVGLLALMAQAGLHIPAQSGSAVSVFEAIHADIGDEQSIEQSLSTFSGHITNIIRILDIADRRSLVILDELGAGTDPQEGAALARSILNNLVGRRVTTLVTTHHPELKTFAHATPGVVNASVEFDLETLRPTFHLTIGLPGRSNALAIAERLGLPESIISVARSEINPDDLRAEDLLDEIHHQRELARSARQQADQARQEVEVLRLELLNRLEQIEEEREKVLEIARVEAEAQVIEVKHELEAARRLLVRAHQPLDELVEVKQQVAELEETLAEPTPSKQAHLGPELQKLERARHRSIRTGDKVRVRSLGAQGVVTEIEAEEAEVQMGMLRVRTRIADLELSGPSGAVEPAPVKPVRVSAPPKLPVSPARTGIELIQSPGMELDLRGMRADEALDALDRYLDASVYAGMPFVRIIHGRGTGKLREVVRKTIKDYPHVASFEPGGEKEGGDGVTIVKFSVIE